MVVAEVSPFAVVAVAAVLAVIEVLQVNPVLVVHVNASAAAEHVATAKAIGDAVPAVALPNTVFVA